MGCLKLTYNENQVPLKVVYRKETAYEKMCGNYTYFGARYYTPELSIWLSVDALSDKYPNLSPFAYCANNPVILVDPDGNQFGAPDPPGKRSLWNTIFNRTRAGNNLVKRNKSSKVDIPEPNSLGDYDPIRIFQRRDRDKTNKDKKMPLDRLKSIGDGTTEFKPRDEKDTKGNLNIDYDPGVNEKGDPVEVDYEIGKMGEDGEIIIDNFSTKEKGSKAIPFDIKKGEHLFIREKSKEKTNSSTHISATKE